MVRRLKLRNLREYSPRDLLAVAIPLLILLAAGFWLASRFIKPAPPDYIVLSSGGEGGAYQRFAASYRDVLDRYGVRMVEKPSGGATENLARLRDPAFEVDVAFMQGGVATATEDDALYSLGAFYNEPLWVFVRADWQRGSDPDRLIRLRGKRIAIGGAGSGTHHLARQLLEANGIDAGNSTFLEKGGVGLAESFRKGEIDAALVVGPTQSATVWTLLYAPGVRLMSLSDADAYARRFPYLSKLVLPRGAVDLTADIPPKDLDMVASVATLVVREETHPALVDLLMIAASEVHSGHGIFQKPGEFPRAQAVDFPLSRESERFYKSGKPFLQRFLPFWAATLVDRLVVMLIPIVALLIPVLKLAPALYTWRVRSRIFRRYGELKFLEAELDVEPAKHTRDEWLKRLAAIEADANRLPTPLAFSDMLYTLRGHIGMVREAVMKKTA